MVLKSPLALWSVRKEREESNLPTYPSYRPRLIIFLEKHDHTRKVNTRYTGVIFRWYIDFLSSQRETSTGMESSKNAGFSVNAPQDRYLIDRRSTIHRIAQALLNATVFRLEIEAAIWKPGNSIDAVAQWCDKRKCKIKPATHETVSMILLRTVPSIQCITSSYWTAYHTPRDRYTQRQINSSRKLLSARPTNRLL